MSKIIIPKDSKLRNFRTLFQMLAQNEFSDFEKIEFVDSNSLHGIVSTPSKMYLVCQSTTEFELESHGKSVYIELERIEKITIKELVTRMNSSNLILLNIYNEIAIDDTNMSNLIVQEIFAKFY